AWNVPEGTNPWKSSAPFARQELDALVKDGIANHKLVDFEAVAFSDSLVPASKLGLPNVPRGSLGLYSRGMRTYHTWVETGPATLALSVKAGLIYGDRGTAKLELFSTARPEDKAVSAAAVVPDKQEHKVDLTTTMAGPHRIAISDAGAATAVVFPD